MFEIHPVSQKDNACLHVVQITDSHIYADKNTCLKGVDTARSLAAVIENINSMAVRPDIILFTGDLVEQPGEMAYLRWLDLLDGIQVPVYCLPGNHDDPELMASLLNKDNIHTGKVLAAGNWRLLLLNTVLKGSDGGHLDKDELNFLQEQLQQSHNNHVLIAMHHHPVPVNSPWMDTMILNNRADFFSVVDEHPQVKVVVWGHIHQDFVSERQDLVLLGSPSSCVQFVLEGETVTIDQKPPAYRMIKLFAEGRVESSVQWLDDF